MNHSATLRWMGQMGLWVTMGHTTVSIDYYASPSADRRTAPPVPAGEVQNVSAFLGTHDHLDHIDHESWKIWAENCPEACFVFPEMHREAVLRDGINPANAIGIDAEESRIIGDVTIRAIPAAHEFLDPDAQGRFPCLQYIIEGNGLRIWHAGDTLRYEGMVPTLRAFGRIDVALLPINGRDGVRYRRNCIGNMTFQEAADVAGEVQPRLVIPGHWDMFQDNSGDPDSFADYLDAKYAGAVKCRIPKAGEAFSISAAPVV